jgi:hypothetical protein
VPDGSIYRGAGKVDFEALELPSVVEEKLIELDENGVEVFRKPGFPDVVKGRPVKPGGPPK